ncbi:hypothetical protein ACFR99_09820 [Haloarchaeobius amylolyticus]|uniref:DUF7344 domain-containing protein n=1 Tax=Haloarchaeobius amylolyticus TaxID=1198296 RepID=A0ABD6BG02_9EURY
MEPVETYRVLASADRQYLLYELRERSGESTITALARRVAVRRHRTTRENLSGAEIDRARIRLVHIHLPKLRDRDLIDVDWSDGTVTFTDDPAVETLFEATAELDDWPPEPHLSTPS